MGENKFTQGDWTMEGGHVLIKHEGGTYTMICDPEGESINEMLANAYLISAAPDLLKACESLLPGPDEVWAEYYGKREVEQAKRAIAKAKGEND